MAFDGAQQARALRSLLRTEGRRLVTRSGRTLTQVANDLEISYVQLQRYLAGALPIRSDQFGAFAEAFETTRDDLIYACLLDQDESQEGSDWMSDNSEAWRNRQRTVLADLRGDASQEEVSRRLGVKYWRWVHLEQAKVRLSPEEFWLFADAFEITPFELARRLGYPSEASTVTFAERLRAHGVHDETIRELLSDVDGRSMHPEAAEAIARHVARDERAHPRRVENRRRANGY